MIAQTKPAGSRSIASTWAVFVCHADQRHGALGFVGADDMLRRDTQQNFGDVWIASDFRKMSERRRLSA
jgi:hypothetical protein